MNRALVREIVRCLSASGEGISHFEKFQVRDWENNLTWLYKSGLTFPLLRKIENDSSVPAVIRKRLQEDFAANQLRMVDMFEEFRSINQAFQSAGLCFAVQKGFSLIPEYCSEPAMRHQTDFDYLITPDCLEQARVILRTRGYVAETHTETELVLQTPLKAQPPEHNFFILQPSRAVELHFRLWQGAACDVHLPAPNDALDHIENQTLHGHTFPALATEDIFPGQAIHILRHIFYFWTRLSWLYEIAQFLLLQQGNSSFWHRVGERAEWDKRMGEVIGVVLCLTEELFGVSAPAALAPWTTETLSPAPRLWVKRYGREFALAPAPGNKLSLLLEEHFMPDCVSWRQSRRARLFPVHRPKPFTAEPPVLATEAVKQSIRQRWLSLLRRVNFHGWSLLRYGTALPTWRWALYRAARKQIQARRQSSNIVAIENADSRSE